MDLLVVVAVAPEQGADNTNFINKIIKMKKIAIIMSVLALSSGTIYSQSQLDAFKYSQTELTGTARYLGMGGAFGALGGDISAMSSNPAGLAIYKSSEVVTTLSVSSVSTKTDWLGSKVDNNRTKVSFDNIAYVGYFPTANDVGVVSWNVGFSYNRVKNYTRNYEVAMGGEMATSLSDYVASRAYGLPSNLLVGDKNYSPYENGDIGDWLSVLGYNAGFMDSYKNDNKNYYSSFGDNDANGKWQPYLLHGGSLRVSERGAVDVYDLSFGLNISELVMLGATVAITDLNYSYQSSYDESFEKGNSLFLDNYLDTDGTGYAFNIGAIVRPVDCLRLGVAYNSPTWYKMTDNYYGEAGSYLTFMEDGKEKERKLNASTPEGAVYDYEFRSPDKWIFSAAAILGTTALISVDYEMTNFKNMRMNEVDGSSNVFTNGDIKSNFKMSNTVRAGVEFKATPQFAIRAGVAYSDSPMKDSLKNGSIEVATVGTIPNYTLFKDATSYTVGLGYRFTPNFYADLACVYRVAREDVYSFSNMYVDNDPSPIITAQPATMKTNTTRVALSIGYKF